jgi:predicted HicB family RNase H-like nuclease
MAHLTLRIEDDIADAIDMLAKAAGMTRSKWISRAIRDALQSRPDEIRDVPTGEGVSKMLSLRFPSDELAAMDLVAAKAGLTRAQWIKRTLRWQLWDRAGELRLIPSSHRSIIKLVSQVRAIGRSLNQAVKAMNAANRPDSPLEVHRIAGEVIAMEGRLSSTINQAASGLTAIASGEVYYWTGRERKLPSLLAIEASAIEIEP